MRSTYFQFKKNCQEYTIRARRFIVLEPEYYFPAFVNVNRTRLKTYRLAVINFFFMYKCAWKYVF